MYSTKKTLDYYNKNAIEFVEGTIDVDFSEIQNVFMEHIKPGGRILDLGCGSGRDSKHFIDNGYIVTAIDGSSELCKKASEIIGQDVICSTFQDFNPIGSYDGIWACASLLHLAPVEIKSVMRRLTCHLNEGGCFYASFKYGTYSGERNGRFFTDYTEDSFNDLLKEISCLDVIDEFVTRDVRPNRDSERWLNVFMKRRTQHN